MLNHIALDTIKKYNLIENNDYIVIGLSGGADSVSLIHFLNSIKYKFSLNIIAVHINHSFRGEEAEKDAKFSENICKELNIPIKIFTYDILKEAKKLNLSFEETGRLFRYKSFEEVLKMENATKIAIAHNKNDNVETFLMRLFRGSGLKGLSGIPFKRNNIVRPLLNCSREIIETYCKTNKLTFINDSSNFEEIYTRNKIRLKLLPIIQNEFNNNIISTISNTIDNFNEENIFLENLAQKILDKCILNQTINSISLSIPLLNQQDPVIIKRILRLSLVKFNHSLYNISSEHINMILNLLQKQSGKSAILPNNVNVKIEHNSLFINNKSESISYEYTLIPEKITYISEINKFVLLSKKNFDKINFLSKVCTICLNCDKIKNKLILREKKNGDKILLNNINKKLKNLFIDLKIPLHTRSLLPILVENTTVIAISDMFVSDNYKVDSSTKNIIYLHIWEE